jgi:hypothetical protein
LIRKNMDESPVFIKAKAKEKQVQILWKKVLEIVTIWNLYYWLYLSYNGTRCCLVYWSVYAMNFMKTVMSIDSSQVDTLLDLILGTPFFVFWLVKW